MKLYGAPLAMSMLVSATLLQATDKPKAQNVKTQSTSQGKETMKPQTPQLQTKVLSESKNPQAKSPQTGDLVTVHYTGWLADSNGNPKLDTKFDSSVDRGTPFQFRIGVGQVIKGWDLGVAQMKEGQKILLTIPAELGYGARGAGPKIPPHSTLVFEVELLKVG